MAGPMGLGMTMNPMEAEGGRWKLCFCCSTESDIISLYAIWSGPWCGEGNDVCPDGWLWHAASNNAPNNASNDASDNASNHASHHASDDTFDHAHNHTFNYAFHNAIDDAFDDTFDNAFDDTINDAFDIACAGSDLVWLGVLRGKNHHAWSSQT